MRYQYQDLYPAQFEGLVLAICSVLLGNGVQPFSSGKDGGKDARFQGTALDLPNSRTPYQGMFVVQAKHTEHPFAKFSDPDFSGATESSVLTQELPRLKKLVQEDEVEHYLLFSNRRLAGEAEATIRRRLLTETGVRNVEIFGIERIEFLIKTHPLILKIVNLDEATRPLRVSSEDIAEVVLALAANKAAFEKVRPNPIHRTEFSDKNKINGLGETFASLIKKRYMTDFDSVRRFLASPPNAEVLERYLEAVAEFNEQIVAHRREWHDFGDALV